MKLQVLICLISAFTIGNCSSIRMKPCCRLKARYGGFERTKQIRVLLVTPTKVAKYETEDYRILIEQNFVNKLLNTSKIKDSISGIETNALKNDTLDLSIIESIPFYKIKTIIAKSIEQKKAVIIDRKTGKTLIKLIKRTYNYQMGPKMGRGGFEYINPENQEVVFTRVIWIS